MFFLAFNGFLFLMSHGWFLFRFFIALPNLAHDIAPLIGNRCILSIDRDCSGKLLIVSKVTERDCNNKCNRFP